MLSTTILMYLRLSSDIKKEKKKGWDNQPLYLPTLVFPKTNFVFMFNYSEEL